MLPRVTKDLSGQDIDRHARRAQVAASDKDTRELTDEELLLTSPIVYGFSFSDKQFCEYILSYLWCLRHRGATAINALVCSRQAVERYLY